MYRALSRWPLVQDHDGPRADPDAAADHHARADGWSTRHPRRLALPRSPEAARHPLAHARQQPESIAPLARGSDNICDKSTYITWRRVAMSSNRFGLTSVRRSVRCRADHPGRVRRRWRQRRDLRNGERRHQTLRVALTDAPACGYDAVNVTIARVRVHQSSSAADGDMGWIDMPVMPSRRASTCSI